MKVTNYGHACIEIIIGKFTLLIDPYITPNDLASHIDVESLSPDYILLTHGHSDHVHDVELIAKQSGATIIGSFEVTSFYDDKGYETHGMNLGGAYEFDFGTLKYVIAHHSSQLPNGSYAGNPGGFVIWNDEKCIYVAGDTALTFDMKLIPLTCPKLNLAILPIGDNFTMGYKDARIAADFVECDQIIGYHYDTFPPIKINHQEAVEYFKVDNKTLLLPEIGESIDV